MRHTPVLITAFFLASALLALPLHAQVELDTTHTSTVSATITESDPTNNVTSLPYVTPVTDAQDAESCIATPDFTTGGFILTCTLTAVDPGATDVASDNLFFIAGPNSEYTLNGNAVSNSIGDGIYGRLDDLTTNSTLFIDGDSLGTTLTLNGINMPLTNPLNAGNLYEWQCSATLDGQPPTPADSTSASQAPQSIAPYTLTASLGLTFTQVPEPASASLFLFFASAQLFRVRRPKQSSSAHRLTRRCGQARKHTIEAPPC